MVNLLRGAVVALACTVFLGSTVSRTTTNVMFQGTPVEMVTLKNKNGMEVQAISYGGIITSLKVPDRAGTFADVVLGFDQSNQYFADPPPPFFGAIVGRYGNRIANGQFVLDFKKYPLAKNNGPNHLHGGNKGFDKVLWKVETSETPQGSAVIFTRTSPDGEEGYPGNLATRVTCDHRQAHRHQPDAAQLLQSRGRRLGRHPRSPVGAERGPLHAG
jgi:aldose 1-epimerase